MLSNVASHTGLQRRADQAIAVSATSNPRAQNPRAQNPRAQNPENPYLDLILGLIAAIGGAVFAVLFASVPVGGYLLAGFCWAMSALILTATAVRIPRWHRARAVAKNDEALA